MRCKQGSVYYDKAKKSYRAFYVDLYGQRSSKRFKTKKEAEGWLVENSNNEHKGLYVRKNDVTVGEWLLQYLALFVKDNVRNKTYLDYLDVAAHWNDYATTKLQQATTLSAQVYLKQHDASDSMKKRMVALMKRAVKKAIELNMLQKNFILGVTIPKVAQKQIVIFTTVEIHMILEYLRTERANTAYYPLVLTAVLTGCRLGEVIGLRTEDLEDEAINIRRSLIEVKGKADINEPKTYAGMRRITVPATLIQLLRLTASNNTQQDGYIFHNQRGNLFRTSNVEKFWKGTLERLEIPHKKFHALRHTHATLLLANYVPILEVAKRLGHSKASHTLNLYGHAVPGLDKDIPKMAEYAYNVRPILPDCTI